MTTTLEVLNHLLRTVGETPVSNPDSNHPTAITARELIDRVSKETQTRGYWFNKEWNFSLQPDTNGYLILPSNTLKVSPVNKQRRLVRRGNKLYDTARHTFAIGEAVNVNLVVQLDIDDLPETAALLIQHRSAYEFYVADDGDEQKATRLERLWAQARAALAQEELQESNLNAHLRPAAQRVTIGIQQNGSPHNPNYPGGR